MKLFLRVTTSFHIWEQTAQFVVCNHDDLNLVSGYMWLLQVCYRAFSLIKKNKQTLNLFMIISDKGNTNLCVHKHYWSLWTKEFPCKCRVTVIAGLNGKQNNLCNFCQIARLFQGGRREYLPATGISREGMPLFDIPKYMGGITSPQPVAPPFPQLLTLRDRYAPTYIAELDPPMLPALIMGGRWLINGLRGIDPLLGQEHGNEEWNIHLLHQYFIVTSRIKTFYF